MEPSFHGFPLQAPRSIASQDLLRAASRYWLCPLVPQADLKSTVLFAFLLNRWQFIWCSWRAQLPLTLSLPKFGRRGSLTSLLFRQFLSEILNSVTFLCLICYPPTLQMSRALCDHSKIIARFPRAPDFFHQPCHKQSMHNVNLWGSLGSAPETVPAQQCPKAAVDKFYYHGGCFARGSRFQ